MKSITISFFPLQKQQSLRKEPYTVAEKESQHRLGFFL